MHLILFECKMNSHTHDVHQSELNPHRSCSHCQNIKVNCNWIAIGVPHPAAQVAIYTLAFWAIILDVLKHTLKPVQLFALCSRRCGAWISMNHTRSKRSHFRQHLVSSISGHHSSYLGCANTACTDAKDSTMLLFVGRSCMRFYRYSMNKQWFSSKSSNSPPEVDWFNAHSNRIAPNKFPVWKGLKMLIQDTSFLHKNQSLLER